MNTDPIPCLDHGFVRLVDVMGDDAAIVQAARVSYNSGSKSPEEDAKLIRYLMKHRHTSPFEMVEFKFHVKMPIFVARQWHRHRTASINEVSGRYTEMKDEFFSPSFEEMRTQDKANKQASGTDTIPDGDNASLNMNVSMNLIFAEYQTNLRRGLSREMARVILPLATYTEFYWKIDLHNLLHFLKLRMDSHAQPEIQVYGHALAKIVKDRVPIAYEAWYDHVLTAVTLTAAEYAALKSKGEAQ